MAAGGGPGDLARDHKHGPDIALKVIKKELLGDEGNRRFQAEIRTTATLNHPGTPAESGRVAAAAARALAHAHERGVIHRDIKPSNILLHAGHTMIADFGISLTMWSSGPCRRIRARASRR